MPKAKQKKAVAYPYMPAGGTIDYVPADNLFMQAAKTYAKEHSLDATMPTGAVLVQGGVVIGYGANGSTYHETHGCERVRLGIPTGQGYELCEGCSPKNHSEPRAIADAKARGNDPRGADIYLWGHWWCCKSCWDVMLISGIKTVYLLDRSEILFNKEATGNVVGKQFLA